MKFKSVLLLAVAMGCGLVAMLGVQQILKGDKTESEKAVTKVLIATVDIGPGMPLDDTNVAFREWPEEAIPEGAITSEDEFKNRALKVRAVPNEIILKAKLGEPGDFGASCDIPDGMRVITVAVDTTMSNSGLIWPGDRVDVLVTYTERDRRLGMVKRVKTVLEYAKVFATDALRDASELADSAPAKTKNISLIVTPEQVETLKLAEDMGKLHLALRRPGDDQRSDESQLFNPFNTDVQEPTVEESGEALATATGSDEVGEFLDQELADGGESKTEETTTENVWTIEIFSNGQRRTEEVALPAEVETNVDESLSQDDDASTTMAASSAGSGNPLVDQLKKIFVKP